MRTLIANGLIIDGSGSPAVPGHLAMEDEKIVGIAPMESAGFDTVIDVKGCVVCPGFIDTHSHSDIEVFKQPQLLPKLMQGITTEFIGQDGVSAAPLPLEFIQPWRKNIAGLDGDTDRLDWTFETTENFLELLGKNGSGTNLCYLAPHGNLRMAARGLGGGLASDEELERLCAILRRELEQGCFGLSTGLVYIPCAYADTRELTELCKVTADHSVPLVIHQRSESDDILDSMAEVIAVGRDSGVWIHFSHFKLCGKNNAPLFDRVLETLDSGSAAGVRISFDHYPYLAGSTMLGVILPPWAHDGGTDKLLQRLMSRDERKKMIRDIRTGIRGWDNFVSFAGLDGIVITNVKTEKNSDAIGKNLVQLGEMRSKEPLEAVFDLLWQEDNAVTMVDFYGLEEHIKALMKRPEMNVCTDGLLGGVPHPRVYGAFARVLGKYVREEKILSLPEAIHKMTGKPASVFGLRDRGQLRENSAADIVVFDPETIRDKGSYENPRQYPEGIRHVFVNGHAAIRDGRPVPSVLAGKVLRKSP
ncbi:MAG: D-aminoacylase [Candidatus Accumulibacter sp.]|jgi:N-acyl-D-amino-acid deacylase|nr:D-aminoacylase [Accumulibacter sp.]